MAGGSKVGSMDNPVWATGTGPAAPTTPRQRQRRRRRRAVAIVLLVLVGLGIASVPAAMVASRGEYGTFSFWKVPGRIDYCGRRYYQNPGTIAGTPTSLTAPYTAPREVWTEVSRTFWLRPVYAGLPTGHRNSAVCAMILYVPAGHGRWWMYPLSGGP